MKFQSLEQAEQFVIDEMHKREPGKVLDPEIVRKVAEMLLELTKQKYIDTGMV